MAEMTYQVAVIGGGPAGYVAAIRAAQLGGKVVLFEKDELGGTCLNRGCIPTKTFLKTADMIRDIHKAVQHGVINDPATSVDMEKVVANKDHVVRQLTGGVGALLRSNGVTVVKGEAALSGEHEIACGGKTYTADSIILCGGSVATRIPIPGIDNPNVLTSTEILALKELPDKLVIIGGGVIGCELACAFAPFGSHVTIVEATDRLIPLMDRELADSLKDSLIKSGIDVRTSVKITEIRSENGKTFLHCADGSKLEADKILLSVGRGTDLSCLGALKDTIRTEKGKVVVDDGMRTSVPHIYAAGDINGRLMLAHTAFKMGETAAENAMGGHKTVDLSFVPSCVYAIPQVASVGMTEDEAVAKYGRDALRIGKFPFAANGRALSCGEPEGYVKVIMLEKYSEFCGVHIFGAQAAEMIAEPTALMCAEMTVEETADMIHAHPSFSEAFMEACGDAIGRCIHLPKKH